jgi:hypothetical protein
LLTPERDLLEKFAGGASLQLLARGRFAPQLVEEVQQKRQVSAAAALASRSKRCRTPSSENEMSSQKFQRDGASEFGVCSFVDDTHAALASFSVMR